MHREEKCCVLLLHELIRKEGYLLWYFGGSVLESKKIYCTGFVWAEFRTRTSQTQVHVSHSTVNLPRIDSTVLCCKL